MQTQRGELALFVTITLLLSSIFMGAAIAKGELGPTVLVVMWSPGLAAIATRLIFHRSLRGMGWGWGSTRAQFLAYALPPLLCLVVYGATWLGGLGAFSAASFQEAVGKETGLGVEASVPLLLLIISTVGLLANALAAGGEEIGWAGFMTPVLVARHGATRASLLVGLFWAMWHYPGILFAGYDADTSPWMALPCFTVMAVGFSFVRTWLLQRSGSLWTAVILHAGHNLFVQAVFDIFTVEDDRTAYFTSEFGIGLALAYGIAALVIWRRVFARA